MAHSVNNVPQGTSDRSGASEIKERPTRSQLFTFVTGRRLLVFFFMVMIFAAAVGPITDPDFWWHLKAGQYIVETRSIPHTDIFSTLRFGSEWVTHEWLSEVFMYSAYRASGFGGLMVLFAIVITIAFWITYRRCETRAPHPYVAGFALLIGAAATIPTWGVRPQMFSILFASLFLAILDRFCRSERTDLIWWLIPLMVLWVNMHAGFAVGLALILLVIVGLAIDARIRHNASLASIWKSIRRLCLLWVLAVAAVSVNPAGLRIYSYPFETLRSYTQMRYIQEWRSPNVQDPTFLALLILIVLTFCVLALSNKRPRPGEMLILLATFVATMRSARNVPFFALVATPLLAGHLWSWYSAHKSIKSQGSSDDPAVGQKVGGLVVARKVFLLGLLPVIVAILIARQVVAKQPQVEAKNFPVAAVEFIKSQNVPQPIYNEYHWGGYLIWKLYPQYRVYIDGRADVYGDALMEEFFTIHDGERSWRKPLDNYGIRTVLVEPDTAIASLLREDPGWQKVFEDQQAVIFIRSQSSKRS